jgi:Na+-translocating ferredoxin:NAD+ oxidoreductase subunit B
MNFAKNTSNNLLDMVAAALPQTQCQQCGQDGCGPFAAALLAGAARPEQCVPGGAVVARRLHRILGNATDALPLRDVLAPIPHPLLARISEDMCIGCTKCLDACPVDALIGAARHLHSVIEANCTGCGLCLPPCPVDCIELRPREDLAARWPSQDSTAARVIAGADAASCTKCEACVPVCPEALRPDHLLDAALKADVAPAGTLRLDACTECNACQAVCPSRIPLTAHFSHFKQVTWAAAYTDEAADVSKLRYSKHRDRLIARESRLREQESLFPDLELLSGAEAHREIAAVLERARRMPHGE